MPDQPISGLAAYSTAHGDDEVEVLDVHDTSMAAAGTNKRATLAQLHGSPGAGQLVYWSGSSPGVPAGAAGLTVGSAGQLNFAAIAAPGSPAIGDEWFDSTQNCKAWQGGPGGLTVYRAGPIYSQVANVTVTATGSSSLISTTAAVGTVTLPAGLLNVVGRTLRVRAKLYFSTVASPGTFYLFLKLGSNTVCTTGSATLSGSRTNAAAVVDIDLTTKATGASGKLDCGGFALSTLLFPNGTGAAIQNGTTAGTTAPTSQVTLDLTSSYVFDLQINLGTSGNSFTITNLTIEVLG